MSVRGPCRGSPLASTTSSRLVMPRNGRTRVASRAWEPYLLRIHPAHSPSRHQPVKPALCRGPEGRRDAFLATKFQAVQARPGCSMRVIGLRIRRASIDWVFSRPNWACGSDNDDGRPAAQYEQGHHGDRARCPSWSDWPLSASGHLVSAAAALRWPNSHPAMRSPTPQSATRTGRRWHPKPAPEVIDRSGSPAESSTSAVAVTGHEAICIGT
jgi:hypothetical protein